MNELALFAGAGGGILGGKLLGWRTVCAVERDAYAAGILAQRQNDGYLEPFPIWSDIESFDGKLWRGIVDVVSGGFPCQDISAAGKGEGIEGSRSGLWGEMARIVGEFRPEFVWVENSPMLVGRGLGVVLGDLSKMGYDARWDVVGAADAGAPHKRDRIWILAYCEREGLEGFGADSGESEIGESGDCGAFMAESGGSGAGNQCGSVGNSERGAGAEHVSPLRQGDGKDGADWVESAGEDLADASRDEQGWEVERAERERAGQGGESVDVANSDCSKSEGRSSGVGRGIGASQENEGDGRTRNAFWESEPDVGRVADGVADRVDRLRGIGNGQVPQAMCLAWERLTRLKF